MSPRPKAELTPLGQYVDRRRRELGFASETAFLEHIPRVNAGEGIARPTLYAWSRDADVAISTRKLRVLARALAGDVSDESYDRELNHLRSLLGRPSVEAGELDVSPELIRELGPAGRRFIESMIEQVVQLRRDVWEEREAAESDGA